MSTEYERSGRPEEPSGSGSGPEREGRRDAEAAPPPASPPPAPPVPPAVPAPTPTSASAPVGQPPPAVPPAVPPSPPTAGPPPAGETPAAPWGAMPPPPTPPRKRRNGLLAGVVAATLIAGGIGGGVGYLVADESSEDTGSAPSAADDDDDGPAARPPDSVAGIAEAALPSVVTIETGAGGESGQGTGFVYDDEGHILTNNHVVASAAEGGTLTATFSDGESYEAEVVGRAEGYDVAVIRLTDVGDRELEPLPMGDSDDVVVGDASIAIGAPYGLSGTVTTGIISAIDRPVASSDATGTSPASYMNALQTDASINPGNSGGPLLNADGEVIGINSAIRPAETSTGEQGGSIGLGFAIPINQAERVAQDLIETGEPVYPIIGAYVDTSSTLTGQTDTQGAELVENELGEGVSPGGPADEAGLQVGDVITEFAGRDIDSGPTLISEIWTHEPGETLSVTYERNGEEHTTEITLDERVGDSE